MSQDWEEPWLAASLFHTYFAFCWGLLCSFGGLGGGGPSALCAPGSQVTQAAEIFLSQGQQLLKILQAVLGAGVHPGTVLLLQVTQAGVHAVGASVLLQGLASLLEVVPNHVHGATTNQPDIGVGSCIVGALGCRLPLRAMVEDGMDLSEHSLRFPPWELLADRTGVSLDPAAGKGAHIRALRHLSPRRLSSHNSGEEQLYPTGKLHLSHWGLLDGTTKTA